jgi:PIN domain nuclease of toxin-antitoxin system
VIVAIADTHTTVWYLFDDPRLSRSARDAFQQAIASGDKVGVSSLSLAEIVYLCEKNRIPADTLESTLALIHDPERVLTEVPLDSKVVEEMKRIPRAEVPDLPDRIVAATGLRLGVPVISRDAKIRAANLRTIW